MSNYVGNALRNGYLMKIIRFEKTEQVRKKQQQQQQEFKKNV